MAKAPAAAPEPEENSEEGGIVPVDSNNVMEAISAMVEDDDSIQDRILRQILQAKDEDQLFGEVTTVSSKDYVDTPFIAHDAALHESSGYDTPYFLSIDAEDPADHRRFIVNTSSQISAVKMMKAKELGILPTTLSFRKSTKPTKAGYYPVDLRKVSETELKSYIADAEKRSQPIPPEREGEEPF